MNTPLDKAKWYIGTMGFSYKDWSGAFYPEELAARGYLTYYSRVFNAVEIDSTYSSSHPHSTPASPPPFKI